MTPDEMQRQQETSSEVHPTPPTPPAIPGTPAGQSQLNVNAAQLHQIVISGARWFYWIAALSVINSLIHLFGGDISFVAGLAASQIVDSFTAKAPFAVKIAGLLISAVCAGIYVLFGFFAAKRQNWAFITGMVLYTLDGLIFLVVKDYWSAGFHGLALYFIIKGFQANQQLRAFEQQQQVRSTQTLF